MSGSTASSPRWGVVAGASLLVLAAFLLAAAGAIYAVQYIAEPRAYSTRFPPSLPAMMAGLFAGGLVAVVVLLLVFQWIGKLDARRRTLPK